MRIGLLWYVNPTGVKCACAGSASAGCARSAIRCLTACYAPKYACSTIHFTGRSSTKLGAWAAVSYWDHLRDSCFFAANYTCIEDR